MRSARREAGRNARSRRGAFVRRSLVQSGLVLGMALASSCAHAQPAPTAAAVPAPTAAVPARPRPIAPLHGLAVPWESALAHPPLDPPLRLTGSFGEYRTGHFHAGVDLSTGEQVGLPVYASLDGHVVRVRSSGVGYGRSLYLLAPDGRLLVYGHLDAFDEPVASYVDSAQRASGQYEQDLWPDSSRFPMRAGQRLGWSGRSGTGPPHLHFEIRRGDIAYNPQLAGLLVRDSIPPVLRRVTVEPLPGSGIQGREGAATYDLEGRTDTLRLFGEARVAVEVADRRANGQLTMAPLWVSMRGPDSATVECRFDSVSWADGMSEVDEVYDRGRTAPDGNHSLRLWAPAGFRPRMIHSSVAESVPAGVLRAGPGATGTVLFDARDMSAYLSRRPLRIAAWDPPKAVRDSLAAPGRAWARIRAASTPGGAALLDRERAAFRPLALVPRRTLRERLGRWTLEVPENAVFEPGEAAIAVLPAPAAAGELTPEGPACALLPDRLPLRVPATLRLEPSTTGRAPTLGVYRESEDGWEWVSSRIDSVSGARIAESRRAGRFALFHDRLAPRITLGAPARVPVRAPYPRWSLEAGLEDAGSGVVARESWLEIDGIRVPSEWDPEKGVLRWTPLRAPSAGTHRVEVIARDRAGNVRRSHGTFVLDSPR